MRGQTFGNTVVGLQAVTPREIKASPDAKGITIMEEATVFTQAKLLGLKTTVIGFFTILSLVLEALIQSALGAKIRITFTGILW